MNIFHFETEKIKTSHSFDSKPSSENFFLHAHRMFEIFYFISGDCYYTVEGTDYPLEPGYILLMRDGEAHTLHVRSDAPYERVSIHFSQDIVSILGNATNELFLNRLLGKNNLFIPADDSAEFIRSCINNISRDPSSTVSEEQIVSYLLPIISELYHIKNSNDGKNVGPFVPAQHGSSETVSKIIEYINNNLVTIKDLEELEREFFFSKSYINRIFKDSTGSSVWDFIILKRLLLARTLLQEGKQANIVASECGFCDYSSFYRQFKKRFNVSPLDARGK